MTSLDHTDIEIHGYECMESVSVLPVDASLEYMDIEIRAYESIENISSVNFLAALAALETNTTLKTLCNHPKLDSLTVVPISICLIVISLDDGLPDPTGEGGIHPMLEESRTTIYLGDPSSIQGSFGVFAGVSDDVNCVLIHILENPKLCDRRAVEMISAGESNGGSMNLTTGYDAKASPRTRRR
jgi:hypothetical protein